MLEDFTIPGFLSDPRAEILFVAVSERSSRRAICHPPQERAII
jgi:hypothetical protein